MGKHYKNRQPETIHGMSEATAERVRLGGELLQAIAHAMAANEKAQRRFRTAVLIRLSKIETMVQMIQVAQMGESRLKEPCFEEKLMEDANHVAEFILKESEKLGLQMVNYVYDESEAPGAQPKKRRKQPP